MLDQLAYLTRIGYRGSIEPTTQTLRALQRAHLFSVPFENLDIHQGHPIRLEINHLFDKIVRRRRGGYCFEVNGLLAVLLEEIGFLVQRLSASSANDNGTYRPDFDHLVLRVTCIDDPQTAWLVDVGWGDGPNEPLRLFEPGEQERDGRVYRLRPDQDCLILEEKLVGDTWLRHYRFNLVAYKLEAFAAMNLFMQSAPESPFVKKRLCSLPRSDGRITLSDRRLILTRGYGLRGGEEKEERLLAGEEEVRQVLRAEFGVDLSAE
jgi:N-hydroxyarylamine O-acetyltransferase